MIILYITKLALQNMTLTFLARACGVQQLAFGRLTAGNDVVATISIILFFPLFLFSVATFSHRRSARANSSCGIAQVIRFSHVVYTNFVRVERFYSSKF